MSRILNQTVLVGGVVYPAGTPEEAIKGRVKREGVWHDSEAESVEEVPVTVREVGESDHPGTVELREFVGELVEVHLADQDRPLVEVLVQVAEEFGYSLAADTDAAPSGDGEGEDEGEGDDQSGALPPTPQPVDYSAMSPADLKGTAESRGLQVEGSGSGGRVVKDDLVKALEADDAAKA